MNGDGRSPGLFPSFQSILVLGVVALLLLLAVGGLKGYRELSAARQREADLEAKLTETRAGIERLGKRVERLRDDPELLEQLARDELMMMRPGELVIVYPREIQSEQPEQPEQPETAAEPESAAATDPAAAPATP